MTIGKNDLTLSDSDIEILVSSLLSSYGRDDLLFQSKANRDAVYKVAKLRDKSLTLRRGSTGYQQLDPRYTVEGSHLPDKGLMNDYRTGFANLYTLRK